MPLNSDIGLNIVLSDAIYQCLIHKLIKRAATNKQIEKKIVKKIRHKQNKTTHFMRYRNSHQIQIYKFFVRLEQNNGIHFPHLP